MSIKYRTSAGTSASNFTDLVVKVGDTLPIGTEVDYDGQSVPAGWQEVEETNLGDVVVDSIRTKNMFNIQSVYAGATGGANTDISNSSNATITNITKSSVSFTTSANWNGVACDFIEVKPSTNYILSFQTTTTTNEMFVKVCFYDSSKTFIKDTYETGNLYFPITTTSSTKYAKIIIEKISSSSSAITLSNIQFEEGDTATAYSPYQELDNQEIYSTAETKIGTWIDGKPLYRKVISSTTPSQANTGTNIYDANSLNIDRIVNLSFNFKGLYNEYATASNVIIMFTRLSGADRQIACTCTLADYCNKPFYFILEYTKTTD